MFSGTAGRKMGKSSTGKSKISEIILNIQHEWNNLKSKNTRNIWKISHFTGCRQVYDNRISRQPGRGTLVITQPTTEDIGEFFCLTSILRLTRNQLWKMSNFPFWNATLTQFLKWRSCPIWALVESWATIAVEDPEKYFPNHLLLTNF